MGKGRRHNKPAAGAAKGAAKAHGKNSSNNNNTGKNRKKQTTVHHVDPTRTLSNEARPSAKLGVASAEQSNNANSDVREVSHRSDVLHAHSRPQQHLLLAQEHDSHISQSRSVREKNSINNSSTNYNYSNSNNKGNFRWKKGMTRAQAQMHKQVTDAGATAAGGAVTLHVSGDTTSSLPTLHNVPPLNEENTHSHAEGYAEGDEYDAHESYADENQDENDESEDDADADAKTEEDYSDTANERARDYRKGGYHPVVVGEIYNNRYRVVKKLGWGYFSTVWLVWDYEASRFQAMKVQKSAKQYSEAAYDEINLLSEIMHADPDRTRCCARLNDNFEHTGPYGVHVCMIFDVYGENLLSLMEQYEFHGIPLPIVKCIARQVLIALDHLATVNIIHTDLKPENVLLSTPKHSIIALMRKYKPPPLHQRPRLLERDPKLMTKSQRRRYYKKLARDAAAGERHGGSTHSNRAGQEADSGSNNKNNNNPNKNTKDAKENWLTRRSQANEETKLLEAKAAAATPSHDERHVATENAIKDGQDDKDESTNDSAATRLANPSSRDNTNRTHSSERRMNGDVKDESHKSNNLQKRSGSSNKGSRSSSSSIDDSGSKSKKKSENSSVVNSETDTEWEVRRFHYVTVADFGNSCWTYKHFTDEVQTRQYRCPEIILGNPYDTAIDIWSCACMIFELITGEFLFDPKRGSQYSRDEDHLALMTEMLGDLPRHMRTGPTRGKHCGLYYNESGELRHINDVRYWDLESVLYHDHHFTRAKAREIAEFLLPMLVYTPEHRATAAEMLRDFADFFEVSEDDYRPLRSSSAKSSASSSRSTSSSRTRSSSESTSASNSRSASLPSPSRLEAGDSADLYDALSRHEKRDREVELSQRGDTNSSGNGQFSALYSIPVQTHPATTHHHTQNKQTNSDRSHHTHAHHCSSYPYHDRQCATHSHHAQLHPASSSKHSHVAMDVGGYEDDDAYTSSSDEEADEAAAYETLPHLSSHHHVHDAGRRTVQPVAATGRITANNHHITNMINIRASGIGAHTPRRHLHFVEEDEHRLHHHNTNADDVEEDSGTEYSTHESDTTISDHLRNADNNSNRNDAYTHTHDSSSRGLAQPVFTSPRHSHPTSESNTATERAVLEQYIRTHPGLRPDSLTSYGVTVDDIQAVLSGTLLQDAARQQGALAVIRILSRGVGEGEVTSPGSVDATPVHARVAKSEQSNKSSSTNRSSSSDVRSSRSVDDGLMADREDEGEFSSGKDEDDMYSDGKFTTPHTPSMSEGERDLVAEEEQDMMSTKQVEPVLGSGVGKDDSATPATVSTTTKSIQ